MATIDSHVDFEIRGDSRGVLPGTYSLAIAAGMEGTPDAAAQSKGSPFGGAFTVAKSPIKVEVPNDKVGGEHDLGSIDLAKYAKK